MKLIMLKPLSSICMTAIHKGIAESPTPHVQPVFIATTTEFEPPIPTPDPMNFRSLIPMLSLGFLGSHSSYGSAGHPVIIKPQQTHATSRSRGRGGFSPKKSSDYLGYKRPSKSRRPQTQFHRLNVLRSKYNIWHESQFNA